jgi:hypothetical protein
LSQLRPSARTETGIEIYGQSVVKKISKSLDQEEEEEEEEEVM